MALCVAEYCARVVVAGLYADGLLEAPDRFGDALEVGRKDFNRRFRAAATDGTDGQRPQTLVIKQCVRFIFTTPSATWGAPRSISVGRPAEIAQKLHERVQILPRIITRCRETSIR